MFDTHVHLNHEYYNEDLQEVIDRALAVGVTQMAVVGFDRPTIQRAMEIAEKYDFIYAIVGWHPVDAIDVTEEDFIMIEQLAHHKKVVALGEMGLDYYWDKSPKDVQIEVFRRQITLAKKVKLPIVIHNREATADVVRILKEENAHEVGGVMHCFTGSSEIAKQCIDMNFYISFGGPVTFKNAQKVKEVAKTIPLNRLLIETDCPFLAPHPLRGKRNEPSYIKYVAETLAELHEISFEQLVKVTTENARNIWRV